MGDCVREMIAEIEDCQHSIKNFSLRVEGLDDEMTLWMAEQLVEEIKAMIDTKKTVNAELGYRKYK